MSVNAAEERGTGADSAQPHHRRPSALGRVAHHRDARRFRWVHGLFLFGLLTWGSLAAWWATYFIRSDAQVREATLRAYAAEQRLIADKLCASTQPEEVLRHTPFTIASIPLKGDAADFPSAEVPGEACRGIAVIVRAEERQRLRSEARTKAIMVAGEGTLLISLMFVSLIALYRMLMEQWRLNQHVEAFVHSVTHELKSPLAGLRALLQTIGGIEMSPADRRAYVDMGLGEIKRLDGMVGNILLSSRLEAAAWEPQVEPLDLSSMLGALADRKRLLFQERGGSLTLDVGALQAKGDREAVEIILENLVDNALKYSPGKPEVRIAAHADGAKVRVSVTDNGVGLDASERAHVFDKFYRSPEGQVQHAKGTGLGLYIARQLARACGGDLRVESEGRGKGARFGLVLPA